MLPHFQPILSVETGLVVAYEALGRWTDGAEVLSLGPFFKNSSRGVRGRLQVDRQLRLEALSRFDGAPRDAQLFLNVNPRFMVDHLSSAPGQLPWTLRSIEKTGIDPRRVVIELTEESVGDQTESLRRLVAEYRAFGCRIAVDDVGAEASNLDRIGFFEPDIIKIDAQILRRSRHRAGFASALAGLRTVADTLGSSLLFEGIETGEDLDQALAHGALYLQGWLFAPAAAEFVPAGQFQETLRARLVQFGQGRNRDIARHDRTLGRIISQLSAHLPRIEADGGVVTIDPLSIEPWAGLACRVFLTNLEGFQVSPNYEVRPGRWESTSLPPGRFRGSLPYFTISGAPTRGGDRIWSVSDPYFDTNDRARIRTFGRAWGPDLLLFVDVAEIENPPLNE